MPDPHEHARIETEAALKHALAVHAKSDDHREGGVKAGISAPPAAAGCFRVVVNMEALTFRYDPDAPGHIGQDQLDLLADLKKTEAAIKEIFYPSGLPAGLHLRTPIGAIIRPHRPAKSTAKDSRALSPESGEAFKKQSSDDPGEPAGPAEAIEREEAMKSAAGRKEEQTKQKFRAYFYQLAVLAQIGLDGPGCQPYLAKPELNVLKDEILTREGGRIKNGYMKRLGSTAIGYGVAPLLVVFVRELAMIFSPHAPLLADGIVQSGFVLCFAWVGAMVGTFLSYALRNPVLTFDQLATPEEDRLVPTMRLVYVGILTEVFMLCLLLRILTIDFGTVKTDNLGAHPSLALLIGVFCGIAERALGQRLVKTADAVGK